MTAPRRGTPHRGRTRPSRRSGQNATGEIVYGRNPVRELLRAGRRDVYEILGTAAALEDAGLAEAPVSISEKSRDALARLAGTGDHQGLVARVADYPYVPLRAVVDAPGPVVCLDGAHDPRNIGAVARVVEAAGGAGLVLPSRGGPSITPVVCKASAGAVEHLLVVRSESIIDSLNELRGGGRTVAGADAANGGDYRNANLPADAVLVVGAEGEGLRPRVRAACDALLSIPMRGAISSLNLSVATGILLFALEPKGKLSTRR